MKLDLFSEAAERYRDAAQLLWTLDSEFERGLAVHACGRQAAALIKLKRHREAADVLSELAGRVDLKWTVPGETDLIADAVPIALGPWPWLLTKVGDIDEAYAAADAVMNAYDPPATGPTRTAVAIALEVKGDVAQKRGDNAAALAMFDEAITRSAAYGLPADRRLARKARTAKARVTLRTSRADRSRDS